MPHCARLPGSRLRALRPSPWVCIRGRRWKEHPDAWPREAPIAEWAAQFESSGLTEKQMRTAVYNLNGRREAGTAGKPAAKKREFLPDDFVEAVKLW